MSKKLFLLPALLLGAMVLFAPACGEDDPCADKDCGSGICDLDGNCNCDPGYEYDAEGLCNVVSRDKFVGNYTVNETCSNSGTATPYPVGITAGASITEVALSGFYGPVSGGGFVAAVQATINGSEITIERQEPDNDNFFVEGSGSIDASKTPVVITITYKVTDETGATVVTNQCNNVTFTKL